MPSPNAPFYGLAFMRPSGRSTHCAKEQSILERDLEVEHYLKVTGLCHNSAEMTHVKSKQRHLSRLELLMKCKQKLCPKGMTVGWSI